MLEINLTNAVSEEAINKYSSNVAKIANKMEKLESVGYQYLGWKDLPNNFQVKELEEMEKIAKEWQSAKVEVVVVVGIGGSFAGTKAAIKMIKGVYNTSAKMEIVFAGESLSSTSLAQKLKYLENKNFAINVISKSGTTTEPAIAFRLLRKMLESKVGVKAAQKLIVATTDATHGSLLKLAKVENYRRFIIPSNIGGRFSVLTPVGLFPLACAGINIREIMRGAKRAWKEYSVPELKDNAAYRYAVARDILSRKFQVELLVQYEPQMNSFNEWWKQLAGESEGKNKKGLFPASAVFSTDLHSLGQFIQEGSPILFETVMTVSSPQYDVSLVLDQQNIDNLNYLASKTVDEINKQAFHATTAAHVRVAKVPNIHIEFDALDEFNFGALVTFFMFAIAMSAYLAGVNPFDQPGVEVYKQNMFKLLGKN